MIQFKSDLKVDLPTFIKRFSLALLFVSGSACAEWVFVTSTSTGTKFYLDPSTFRQDGDVRTVWSKREAKVRDKDGVYSTRTKLEIDCKKELVRMLAFTSFADPDLEGQILWNQDNPDAKFSSIAPDTVFSTYMKILCLL